MGRLPSPDKVAAQPTNRQQELRRRRLLDAAAELGERDGFEAVQTNEIAKEAGVAIATLYRYFPTKTHLFATVLHEEIKRFTEVWFPTQRPDRLAEVGDLLVALAQQLITRPRLAAAMVHSATVGYAPPVISDVTLMQIRVRDCILGTIGIAEPDDEDLYRAKLLQFAWWGVLVSMIDEQVSNADAEKEIRAAARLLLTSCSCWRAPAGARSGADEVGGS